MILLGLVVVGVLGFVAVPRVSFWLAHAPRPTRAAYLPWVCAALFVVSWRLPNPSLEGTSTFTQHAVGGGAACAVAGLFVALNAGLWSSILRVAFAYAVAASMGVGVELLELVYDQAQGTNLTADSAWDLLADTTGAVVTAITIELVGGRLRQISEGALLDDPDPFIRRELLEVLRRPDPIVSHRVPPYG